MKLNFLGNIVDLYSVSNKLNKSERKILYAIFERYVSGLIIADIDNKTINDLHKKHCRTGAIKND